ncbi:MAG: LexA family transcriptional regulator [Flavobacteriales bacterium]|nr:LexA family transcriptional regulator [Flavobacteriales bacterium]
MRVYGIANVSALARELGYERSERIRKVMIGENLPSYSMLEDIARKFADLNPRWLLTGEGSPLRVDSAPPAPASESQAAVLQQKRERGIAAIEAMMEGFEVGADVGNIIMLDSKAAAGLPANYGNAEYLRDQPRLSLPGHKYRGAGLIALQVEGDSMDPTVRHDDWIIAKLLTDPVQELREGYLYVLVTRDGCVAKRLYRTVTDAFLCKSDNEDYPPYEQAIGPGDQVYKALALFSENLSHRRDGLFDRLVSLEKAVMRLQTKSKGS